jgi:uncharacterized protein
MRLLSKLFLFENSFTMSTTLQPTLQSTRNYFLDLWRGFAITGVLIAYIMWNLGNLPEKDWSSVDKIIAEFTRIFIDGKFYTTLSILFGYGFYLQVEKSRLNHQSVVPFALRRTFLLLLIGTIHAVLLRRGDILMPYAICSLYLFFARNAGNKTLIALMLFCFLFPLLYYQFIHWIGYKNRPWEADSGSYLHYMWVAFRNFHKPVYFFVQVFDYFLLFLLGFYAAKNNWLQKLSRHPNQLLLLFIAGVALGIGMYYAMETGDKWFTKWFGTYEKMSFGEKMISGYAGSLFYLLHRSFLAVGYFAGLYFLYLRSFKMTAFVNMGRMALSNYLLQSLIMIPACFIFGLFGKFTPVTVIAWSAGIWIAQAIFSTWWLKYYNFGPFEWLLRSFTYRRWQVIKTESSS